GVDAYLAVRARAPKMTRADLEALVEASRVQVIPAVRGCIYLVPRAHVALALRFAEDMVKKRNERELEKVGVTAKEIAEAGKAIVKAIGRAAMTADALRKALPAGAVRSLGEVGKKVGISSTLPVALRELEFQGKIERALEGGRLDTERYAWRIPKKSPFDGA